MFMTPRGLKIRLEVSHGFTLLGRLWAHDRNTDAFKVLKTAEALESVPSILSFALGAIALVAGPGIWYVPVGLILGSFLGKLLTMFGLVGIPGLVAIGTVWSWVAGYGLIAAIGIGAAWLLRGWPTALTWLLGIVASIFISELIIEPLRMTHYKNRIGYPLTQAEVNFFNAYRIHADRLGIARDIELADEEVASGHWEACLEDYAKKYPEAVARFIG